MCNIKTILLHAKRWGTKHIGIILTLIISSALFSLLFSKIFDPTYVDWLYIEKWDPFQYYISWALFRFSEWHIPIINTYAAFPIGISPVYTDTIPLLAFFFKVLSGWNLLPTQFQYFGLWILVCFWMQGIFSYVLIKQFTKRTTVAVIGSIFFVLSPIMLFRMPGQFAHSSHWLLLAAIYLYLRPKKSAYLLPWLFLLNGSLLIHGYTFVMILAIYGAFCLDRLFIRKKRLLQICTHILVTGIILLLTMYVSGFFFVESTNTPGYGRYSMNLISLINPVDFHEKDWSYFLPVLPQPRLQYEGFNYLGVGMMALIFIGLGVQGYAYANKKYSWSSLQSSIYAYWPLLMTCFVLFLLAISHHVYLANILILSIPLPLHITDILGTIRGSGRMFWPIYYLIFLLGFRMLAHLPKRTLLIIVIMTVSLQVIDLHPKLVEINHKYENKVYVSPLTSSLWKEFAKEYKHISFIPRADSLFYEDIAIFAEKHGLTLNDMLLARPIKGNYSHIRKQMDELRAGSYAPQTLYLFKDGLAEIEPLFGNNPDHYIDTLDGYPVFAPNFYRNRE